MDVLPHERREWLPAYSLVLGSITTILLVIRLLSRALWRGGGLGLDDFFITLGWAVAAANTGLSVHAATELGYDRHIWDIDPADAPNAIKYGFVISILYVWSTSLTKLSILLFYRRLVAGTYSKRYRYSIWIALAALVTYTIVIFALIMTTCFPLDAVWMKVVPAWVKGHDYRCASNRAVIATSYASGILSVVTDFYTVLLPCWLFFSIQMDKKRRIATMSVFSVGFLVVIAGTVRTVYLVKAEGPDIDKTWNIFNVIIAGTTEGDFGIMCACAPSLKSAFSYHFGTHGLTQNTGVSNPSSNSWSTDTGKRAAVRNGYVRLSAKLRKGGPAPPPLPQGEELILQERLDQSYGKKNSKSDIDQFGFSHEAWAARSPTNSTCDLESGIHRSSIEYAPRSPMTFNETTSLRPRASQQDVS
ncbi:uncharacterized protein PV09_03234 [Verruconis gallopava]|uniref:Rhodopsin domain-containing protein n=1 Tax=Verruconis gallopava TaxID=253628 RepID=A0A0D1XTL0_9PEZI|nr:uncharacterized protein PV09_03234 [Verruconis gallopava]KIW06061.1 hypothetical protein PV09_03234 [Verruconis gallopava]